MVRSIVRKILPLVPVMLGCSSSAQARQCPDSPEAETAATPATPGAFPAEASPSSTPVDAPKAAEGELPNTSTEASSPVPAATGQSLPELTLKITGMHIGGGPNDAETKRPFMEAIEAGFDQMRDCYRKADDPAKGGTYGVDLRVERAGGHPTVQGVRTALKGESFRSCLESSFQGLSFGKPAKGPTVLSVSVKFSLGE